MLPLLLLACAGPVTPEGTVLRKMDLTGDFGPALQPQLRALEGEEKSVTVPFGAKGEAELKVVFTRVLEPGTKTHVFKDLRVEVSKNPRYEVTPGLIGQQVDMRPPGLTGGKRFMTVPLGVQYGWRNWSGSAHIGALTMNVHVDGTLTNVRNEAGK